MLLTMVFKRTWETLCQVSPLWKRYGQERKKCWMSVAKSLIAKASIGETHLAKVCNQLLNNSSLPISQLTHSSAKVAQEVAILCNLLLAIPDPPNLYIYKFYFTYVCCVSVPDSQSPGGDRHAALPLSTTGGLRGVEVEISRCCCVGKCSCLVVIPPLLGSSQRTTEHCHLLRSSVSKHRSNIVVVCIFWWIRSRKTPPSCNEVNCTGSIK